MVPITQCNGNREGLPHIIKKKHARRAVVRHLGTAAQPIAGCTVRTMTMTNSHNKGYEMDKFFPAILCILAVVCAGALSGCTTAVPYAISAAKIVTDGGLAAANHAATPTTAGQASASAAANSEIQEKKEAQRPYQLVEQKKYDEALPLLRERADKNDAQAQEQMAMLYFEGKGVPEDSTKAAEWMQKAAELGRPESQYLLAWFYYRGTGVPRDYEKALLWVQRALAKGDSNATNLLGLMYRTGRGVPKDYTKALELFYKADKEGNIYAPANIAYMYKNGQGVSQDYQQAINWYSKAAEKGNVSGWIHLAYLYATCQDMQYVDGRRAVSYAVQATQKDPNHFASWAVLAAAYARNNEFDKAIETATKADAMLQADTKLDAAEKQDALSRAELRLASYREGRAYTEVNDADEEN